MAATKNDSLFEKIIEQIKEIQLNECDEHGLNEDEMLALSEIGGELVELWDGYLDRLIDEIASKHPNPEMAVALAGADVEEMEAAQERVRTKLIEQGVPLGTSKKRLLN